MPASVSVTVDGAAETRKAIQGVQENLDRGLRDQAGRSSGELGSELRSAASSSGVPVARRVARSIRVEHGKTATVSIGGGMAVGARGAPASDLLWGSEHGGRNFAVPAGGSYWIAPAVDRYRPKAIAGFERSVDETIQRQGL